MNSFELTPQTESFMQPKVETEGLGSAVLLNNARWFTQVRWTVVSVFVLLALLSFLLRVPLQTMGIHPPFRLTLMLASCLGLANVLFSISVKRMTPDVERHVAVTNIWTQIIVDLLAVTVLVHYVGSTDTFIPFTYLFHITLAGIFLCPRNSLLVTLLATGLYFGCVALELREIIPHTSIFFEPPIGDHHDAMPWLRPAYALSAVFFWFLVWYLIATFSRSVRDRDRQLDQANRKLLAADREKNLIVLRTTHDLKAPFTGMEMQIGTLRRQYWNELSPPIQDIMEKIMTRAATLRKRINDIMTLGSLRSAAEHAPQLEPVELDEVLGAAVLDVSVRADERKITLNRDPTDISVYADARQLHILFANLIANAVFYSHDGGRVTIAVTTEDSCVLVRIADQGIGIGPNELPHIFDEYYRTKTSAQFNKMSTGLGLAIVHQIVANFGYTIRVESDLEVGTTFEVRIPLNAADARRQMHSGPDTQCGDNP